MAVYYCTAADVASFLQFNQSTGFNTTTKPTQAQVEMLINTAEDQIDNITNRAWRSVAVSDFEQYDTAFDYQTDVGIPIFLKHRKIRTLSAIAGDALQVWNGSTWEDWLANETEGRADDYWLDYSMGVLYIRAGSFGRGSLRVQVKYHYGETTVNGAVKLATIKLTAADIISGMDGRSIVLPEGSSQISPERKAQMWRDEAMTLLQPLIDPIPLIPAGASLM